MGEQAISEEKLYRVEVFYDAECPLCFHEIRMLQWLDRNRQQIRFTNIVDPDFDPQPLGKTFDELMAEIHGRMPDGTWLVGVEVFRQIYSAVGFGFLVWPSRLPGISHFLDGVYGVFARNRLRLTGRCDASCKTSVGAESKTA